jgi:deoxyribonuclease (pyrimidine dimer)
MTRINLVHPSQLSDQHLIVEYRELPRIVNDWKSKKGDASFYKNIPAKYVLGTGHVRFFRDKIKFLVNRHKELVQECIKRNFKIKYQESLVDSTLIVSDTRQIDYIPTKQDIFTSQERIDSKIKQKPNWYKYYGKPKIN